MKKKFTESISLSLRKKWITSGVKTFLISVILILSFFILNIWIGKQDLPKLDVTENKIYTLSNNSIDRIKDINQDVKIYVYGYKENDTIIDLLKQYNKNCPKINYEIITDESNLDIIKKYALESGNLALIFEAGTTNKILFSSDLYSYDYTTYQQIDLTENAITNTILNLTIAEKPKVYFLTGHNELSPEKYLSTILAYLENEVFEYSILNLLTTNAIPEECDLIAIMSPQTDLLPQEVNLLQTYINNGGNIIFTSDLYTIENINLPNLQQILDMYGISLENGAVYETDTNSFVANSPFLILPKIASTEITSEIYTDGVVVMELPKRIKMAEEAKLTELGVEYETLLSSSEKSFFVTDFSENAVNSIASQTPASSIISAKITKTIPGATESENKISEMVAIANGTFVSSLESVAASGTSQVNLYNNADFFISSVANLTDREDTVSVRKEMSSSTYTPTKNENNIVLIIIFIVPLIIMIFGILVWNIRKRKR
ncbi:MAG: GldG family protein [Clostridia bacterium]|nr:GldG family protein [Clostridia bacterium]